MTKIAKKASLLGLVLSVSWLGVSVGQGLTHQIFSITSAQAASFGSSDSRVASSKEPKDPASAASKDANERYENLELFQKVLHFVETNYVDDNIKTKDLIYGALKGMMETLDPHSNFLPPDVWKDMKIDTSGKFGGLGIEIGMKDNILTIIAPIEDTPAWKAGLKPNDRIVKIDGESTKGMNLVEAVNKMRGKKGTDVSLSVYRDGWDKIKDINVRRDIIKIQSVKSEELEPGFGYIRLTSFNESAAPDMKKAIDKLQKNGPLKGLVFDLRMNPGGLLDQAVDVSSLFIDEGVVVSTIPRNKDQKEVKYAKKGMAYKDFPVVILVNSSTASAAEIVSGALQDHHRAIIMGQPTFGKGSVQTVVELGNDVGLKLTIARYYTPSGRSIQDRGVQPDILLDDYDPKLLSEAVRKGEVFREVDLKGHMANPDGVESNTADADGASTKKAGDYKKEELESLSKGAKKGKGDKSKDDDKAGGLDDDMSPMKFNAKDDYQVREAVNYLKGFEVFKKIATPDATPSPGKKSAAR
jgi:carboxyl-terminal processing protease